MNDPIPMLDAAHYAIGIVVAMGVVAFTIMVGYMFYMLQDPPGMIVSAEVPEQAELDREFVFTVSVRNDRPDRDLIVNDIDLNTAFFKGFDYVDADPSPANVSQKRNETILHFNKTVSPGKTEPFALRFKAIQIGDYHASLDVFEGKRFLTVSRDLVVVEPGIATLTPGGAATDADAEPETSFSTS